MLKNVSPNKVYHVEYRGTVTKLKVLQLYTEKVLQGCVKVEIMASTDPRIVIGWQGGYDKDFLLKHGTI